jgi:hypothetical protein
MPIPVDSTAAESAVAPNLVPTGKPAFDLKAIAGLAAILPLAYAPQILKLVTASPFVPGAGLAAPLTPQVLPGLSTLEPCMVLLNWALGHRAALDWLSGSVPWWNPYQGIGIPLAADMQSAALFLPFILLYKFPWGQLVSFALLQFISGVSTYFLVRQLGGGRTAAFTAGALFQLQGMFVLFRTAILSTTAFFPLLLLGVEKARQASLEGRSGAWRLIAVSLALALYAGYPESVYINGLLVAVWSALRFFQMPSHCRLKFCQSLFAGVFTSLLLSAPVVVPFLEYLKSAFVGIHSESIHGEVNLRLVPQLFFPYMYGPIWGNLFTKVPDAWSAVGAYFGAVPLFLVVVGLLGRHERALRIMLVAWMVCSFGKAFEVFPFSTVFNLLPLMKITLYSRYHYPTITMAVCLLVAFAMDDLLAGRIKRLTLAVAAAGALLVLTLSPLLLSKGWLSLVSADPLLHAWPSCALSAGIALAVASIAAAIFCPSPRWKVGIISCLIVVEAVGLTFVANLCRPRAVHMEMGAVKFLQQNLGLQRFYTIGPIEPNIAACFGIASINHNDLPIPRNWAEFVDENLLPLGDRKALFNGVNQGEGITQESALAQLQRRLEKYKWVGVKYIVVPAGTKSFLDTDAKLVFQDAKIDVHELSGTSSYFEAPANCLIEPVSRTRVVAHSTGDTTLIRRELYFPGWTASVNGKPVAIEPYKELLQSLKLPAGRSEVVFNYAPPNLNWCLLAMAIGLGLLGLPIIERRFDSKRAIPGCSGTSSC